MPWRIDSDHHRAMDGFGIGPGVDHGGARTYALAEQVHLLIAQRETSSFQVMDAFKQRIARYINTLALESLCALGNAGRKVVERRFAEHVIRSFNGFDGLGAIEDRRTV